MLKTLTIAAITLAAVATIFPVQAAVEPNGQGTQGDPMQGSASGAIELQGITLTDGRGAGVRR